MHYNCYKNESKELQPDTHILTVRNKTINQLNTYSDKPNIEFNIDELESYALSRLKVLRWIDSQTSARKSIANSLHRILQDNYLHIKKHDQLSHFIARICFCQTSERRRWFVKLESQLFAERYRTANLKQIQSVHSELCGGKTYDILSKQMIINNQNLNGKHPIPFFQSNVIVRNEKYILPYHKVPFAEVLRLVGRRKLYISDGYAYVPQNLFYTIIVNQFSIQLHQGLISAQKAIAAMENDSMCADTLMRIKPVIEVLHTISNVTPYKISAARHINAKDINTLNNKHFPLCMQLTTEHLQTHGHLKHGGRMHLGLFLKGIGLSLQQSLLYWSHSFKKIGSDKFNKQYAYNVRHNYGKEGKRIDYTPYSCNKIISCKPNNGDCHGCPFKIYDMNILKRYLLTNKKINNNDVNIITNLVTNNQPRLSCKHYFYSQHKNILIKEWTGIDDIKSQWSHPNEYFDNSYRLYYKMRNKKKNKG
eukprot:30920_1